MIIDIDWLIDCSAENYSLKIQIEEVKANTIGDKAVKKETSFLGIEVYAGFRILEIWRGIFNFWNLRGNTDIWIYAGIEIFEFTRYVRYLNFTREFLDDWLIDYDETGWCTGSEATADRWAGQVRDGGEGEQGG